MAGNTIFTIGYQGTTLGRLIETIAGEGVSVLVDTRETPMSWRPEFRRRSLEAACVEAGIGYVSAPEFGAPKALRALATAEWDSFAEGYRERLALVGKERELLVPLLRSERVCLLCFELTPTLATGRSWRMRSSVCWTYPPSTFGRGGWTKPMTMKERGCSALLPITRWRSLSGSSRSNFWRKASSQRSP